ncbi:MAG: alkaline phytoceramidase [Pseudogulbenkiania sp.]|nr:alkaline phytoceramidase [Pseudogulbenkiania sp.]
MPRISRRARLGILAAGSAGFALAPFLLPPLVQPLGYHDFADKRALLGIPHALDVVTNLPFLLIGLAGLVFLSGSPRAKTAFRIAAEKWPYALFFLAVALTSAGSAYYHLAPDNARLAWDRLPMSMGFMALLTALIAERVSLAAGLRLLLPLVTLGLASVGYWRWSALAGRENLLPYLAVQFGTAALVLLITGLFPSPYTRAHDIYWVAALYLAAKVAEGLDTGLFALGGVLSGHSLKHLLAAGAAYQLLRMLLAREIKPPAAQGVRQ